MFEAVLAICIDASQGPCRDALVPGYEALSQELCEALLEASPPEIADADDVRCQKTGEVLEFGEVAPGVFVHMGRIAEPDSGNRGDVSNIGFVIGDESVAVIDTGTAAWMGEAIWRAVRQRTDKPVSHVVLTHMHPDHVLGASFFQQTGTELVGHAGLPRALADRQINYLESLALLLGGEAFAGTSAPHISMTVDQMEQIDLGGRKLLLTAWPMAHTSNDLTVLDEQTGTLFTGDLVFHRHTPALDGKLRGWQSVLKDLAATDVERVVPGHGGPVLPWPDGAGALGRYLDRLAEDTMKSIDAGERLGDAIEHIAQSEAANWELFEAFNPRNATVAFTELEWE